ncbi:MAG: biopolymer transporter ExbD [Betaproteobacteria bacterium]|nr:biopolymer transporter ExbD [Betaproteobacteria bacterium]
MKGWNEAPRRKARIEIIPMIDVMMFLLVFFVLISINVIPAQGLKTNIPKSSTAVELLAPKRVVITIPFEGPYMLDGKEIGGLAEVAPALLREKATIKMNQKFIVILNGDDNVPLQKVIDLMDVVKQGGFDTLTIAAKKKK